jgi:hypothetical protein
VRSLNGGRVAEVGELEREAERMLSLCRKVRNRINNKLVAAKDWLPSPPEVMALEWYTKTVLGLLKEQRLRAAMTAGLEPMSEAEFEAELDGIVAERVRKMSDEKVSELRRAKAGHAAMDTPSLDELAVVVADNAAPSMVLDEDEDA